MQTSYKVSLSFGKRAKNYCVFGIPQTNQYQEISNLSFDPKPANLVFDEWGNMVAIFVDKTVIKFAYSPKHVEKTIDKKWTVKDYKINKEIGLFIKPNRFINGKDPKITKLVKELIKKEQNVSKIARIFYDFVLNYLAYGKPTEGLYPYTQAFEEKVTDCGGFSTLLLSLFQSIGIPGRLVVGFVLIKKPINTILEKLRVTSYELKDFSIHAWTEILLPDNSWFPMDASVEWKRVHRQSNRQGGFGKNPSDRLVTSFGQDFQLTVNNQQIIIDLLQYPVYV